MQGIFLRQHRFDRVGIFTYSHEEGTSAHGLVDDVPQEEKETRAPGDHGSTAGDQL